MRVALCSVAAAAACTQAAPPPPPTRTPPHVSASASRLEAPPAAVTSHASAWPQRDPTPPADLLATWRERLTPLGVSDRQFATATLWSWTSEEQGRDLLAASPVLSREVSPTYGPSAFDWMLQDAVKRGDPLARLLFRTGFAKKRFAWPNAYATALGGGGERYGSVLLRLDLAPDALVLHYGDRKVATAGGKPSSLEELLANPERLAAVYWEGEGYREYVVVNESQLRAVAVGTAEVTKAFMEERALVEGLASALRALPAEAGAPLLSLFAQTLAFQTTIDREGVEALGAELARIGLDGLDGAGTPRRSFALGGPRAPLKGDCILADTGDRSFPRRGCLPANRCTQDANRKCVPMRRSGINAD